MFSSSMAFAAVVTMAMLALAAPTLDAATLFRNGQEAQKLNVAFQSMKASDSCTNGEKACMSGGIAACRDGVWAVPQGFCSKTQDCFALPSVHTAGTDVMCTSEKNALSAIEATGTTGGIFGNSTSPAGGSDSEYSKDEEDGNKTGGIRESDHGAPVSASSSAPEPTTSSTVTVTETVTQVPSPTTSSKITHTVTEYASTTTQTITIGDKPVTLPPTTRTISPEEASSILSKFLGDGATIIEVPTASVTQPLVEATITASTTGSASPSTDAPSNPISLIAPTSTPAA